MDYRSVIITIPGTPAALPGTRMPAGTISSELGNHVPEAHLVQRGYSVTDPGKRRPATWHRAR
jgi:hypothetical protein